MDTQHSLLGHQEVAYEKFMHPDKEESDKEESYKILKGKGSVETWVNDKEHAMHYVRGIYYFH
jgi:hypothetical protein